MKRKKKIFNRDHLQLKKSKSGLTPLKIFSYRGEKSPGGVETIKTH